MDIIDMDYSERIRTFAEKICYADPQALVDLYKKIGLEIHPVFYICLRAYILFLHREGFEIPYNADWVSSSRTDSWEDHVKLVTDDMVTVYKNFLLKYGFPQTAPDDCEAIRIKIMKDLDKLQDSRHDCTDYEITYYDIFYSIVEDEYFDLMDYRIPFDNPGHFQYYSNEACEYADNFME